MHSKPYKNGSEQTSHLLQSATVWALKAGFGARQLGSWAAGQPVSLESLTFLDFFPDFTLHAFKAHVKEDQLFSSVGISGWPKVLMTYIHISVFLEVFRTGGHPKMTSTVVLTF